MFIQLRGGKLCSWSRYKIWPKGWTSVFLPYLSSTIHLVSFCVSSQWQHSLHCKQDFSWALRNCHTQDGVYFQKINSKQKAAMTRIEEHHFRKQKTQRETIENFLVEFQHGADSSRISNLLTQKWMQIGICKLLRNSLNTGSTLLNFPKFLHGSNCQFGNSLTCSDETADKQSAEGGALEDVAWDFGTPATI
jgi:hypothetical protein